MGSDTIYVYAIGIDKDCYIDDTWPRAHWNNNTIQYVREYSYKQLNEPQLKKCLCNNNKFKVRFGS